MEKSYVGIGVSVCPVCGAEHDAVVLLDRRLQASLKRRTAVGWAMCPEHKKRKDDGYIALIECNNRPHSLNDADRTGAIAHVRREAWSKVFNVPVPSKGLCFVEVGTIAKLQEKTA